MDCRVSGSQRQSEGISAHDETQQVMGDTVTNSQTAIEWRCQSGLEPPFLPFLTHSNSISLSLLTHCFCLRIKRRPPRRCILVKTAKHWTQRHRYTHGKRSLLFSILPLFPFLSHASRDRESVPLFVPCLSQQAFLRIASCHKQRNC